ncbi:DUF5703 domain-containing protein [Pedobacter sp.]|jgi:alpha-L-fucosidase 2|uniref:DUF5703 domain-containing protein n=1 Tax=Pedobacter sp. TaxID=1411316 RepID=UPI002CD4DF42|nr:DUF5703 domain-containing protein [Pedobacter sp.]HWW40936.1 DUF5703 domain-containing protein [Pedobacter sp.]
MMNDFRQSKITLCSFLMLITSFSALAQQKEPRNIESLLKPYNVTWDIPGPTSLESMPIGNGDIGLNVWAEPNGDVVFFTAKTDAWSEDNKGLYGLLKLGGMRLSLSPSPFKPGGHFLQTLKLHEGEIEISEGEKGKGAVIRIWVDANNPVVRVEVKSDHPVSAKFTLDNWRITKNERISADVIMKDQVNRIVWYHRNGENSDPEVLNRTFGAAIKGIGMTNSGPSVLKSTEPAKFHLISIYPLTVTTTTSDNWLSQLNDQVSRLEKVSLPQSYKKHQQWWGQFWKRSWIYIDGDQAAQDITGGYVLQRFVTACAGRGSYPVKFNGSIFNVNHPKLKLDQEIKSVTADYRKWGGQYWFQNTRAMYWPRLMAGDFDVMRPFFDMYVAMIPANTAQVKKYYNHNGAYFAETAPFWGGLGYWGPEVQEDWTGHYFTPVLELSMMMLDYYKYTEDQEFAKKKLLPVAEAGITFFDQHFKRDENGKLLLDPVNSIEQFWKVYNPAPDIAGLHALLQRLIDLPDHIAEPSIKVQWKRLLQELPVLPVGIDTKSGDSVLLPYSGQQTAKPRNRENPELYSIYPFRIYGLGKPNLKLAISTFNARKERFKGCWTQDPIQAALLGITNVAKEYTQFAFNLKDPELKFPAFWSAENDYQPDQDNGGNAENALQLMLMQCEGEKIMLLPAWPKEWNADFKLNAPFKTTVQGKIVKGKLTDLIVTPAERKKDVIDMSIQ